MGENTADRMRAETENRGKRKIRTRGFTLVELIVVLVILGILAAIMVPSLIGWIDKAKNQDAILECRAVVVAAQGQAAEEYAKSPATDIQAIMNNANIKEAVLKLSGVAGDIVSTRIGQIKLQDSLTINKLSYTSSKGIKVIYEVGHSPIYYIDEEDGYTNDVPGYNQQVLDLINNGALDASNLVDGTYNEDNKGHGKDWTLKEKYKDYIKWSELGNASRRVQAVYLEKYDGTFPAVDWSQMHFPEMTPDGERKLAFTEYNAVWKPIVTKEKETIMIATSDHGAGAGMATVIYRNGEYYYHFNKSNKIDQGHVSDTGFSVNSLTGQWVKFNN